MNNINTEYIVQPRTFEDFDIETFSESADIKKCGFSCKSIAIGESKYAILLSEIIYDMDMPRVVFNRELLRALSEVYRLENHDAFYETEERAYEQFIPYVNKIFPEIHIPEGLNYKTYSSDLMEKIEDNLFSEETNKKRIDFKSMNLYMKLYNIFKVETRRLKEHGITWLCDYVARKVNDKEGVEFLRKKDPYGYTKTFLKLEEKGTNIEDLIKTTLGAGYTFEELHNLAEVNYRYSYKKCFDSIEDYLETDKHYSFLQNLKHLRL